MLRRIALVLAASAALCACGAPAAPPAARWREAIHLRGVVDLTPPRSDGRRIAAADGELWLIRRGGVAVPFAPGYRAPPNADEPYIALASGAGCFARDGIYALAPAAQPAIVRIDRRGHARRFASLPGGWFLSGIAFDPTGDFGHRLLVTATKGASGRVFAIDCHGASTARRIPKVEGGLAVAPRSFGRFGGNLIAPDENSGRVYAIDRHGHARLLARSGLPHGGDIGVESAGFVPALPATAHLADRATPGNPHPGTDSVLALRLTTALVRPGDLLVATEGGAETIAIHCSRRCSVRHVADGPAVTHAEGHIAF